MRPTTLSTADLSRVPVISPPSGKQSNFVDPPNSLAAVVATTIILQLFTFPFIAARAYVNIWTRAIRAEDVFSYIAWIVSIAQAALICTNAQNGMAAHAWDVSQHTMIEGTHRYNIIFIFYTFSGGFAKATVSANAVNISSYTYCSYLREPNY
jgi:hypothetical protein